MKNILLTGANGFLGAYMLDALLAKGYRISILIRTSSNLNKIKHHLDKIDVIDVNITPISKVFEKRIFESIIHLACCYGRNGETDVEVIRSNILFGAELLSNAIKNNTRSFINASTFSVDRSSFPQELKSYILSKRHFTEWLEIQSNKIKVVNIKIEHIFGLNDSSHKFIPWVISEIKNGYYPITLHNPNEIRDFVNVKDVVSAFLFLLEKMPQLGSFTDLSAGSGSYFSIQEFVRLAENLYKKQKILKELIQPNIYPPGPKTVLNKNVDQLKQLGWHANCTLEKGILELIN
jgi:nucleoside-diphosphate-sugar epimerase